MMRACCAATTPRLGELMGSASRQELEIKQDAVTRADTVHSTNMYCYLSLLTDGKALDSIRNSLVNNGMEEWRRMVTRGETKVSPGTEDCCRRSCSREIAAESQGKLDSYRAETGSPMR